MTTSMWCLPVAEEFAHPPFVGRIRERQPSDFPGAQSTFFAMYSRPGARRQHGWSQEFHSLDECRQFLIQKMDNQSEATRKRSRRTRQRRQAERIAKITREFLLGKGIGNQRHCQICNKELTDPASIQRGLGSECWPSFQDHLAKEVPRCEQTIETLKQNISESRAKLADDAYWLVLRQEWILRRTDPEIADRHVRWEKKQIAHTIDSLNRDIADTERLQASARKWLATETTP
jgi:hypothetical protein